MSVKRKGLIWLIVFPVIVLCVLLDYVLVFSITGIAPLFARLCGQKRLLGYSVGAVAVGILRFISHALSGVILWGEYAPPEIHAEIALTHAWRGDYTQAAAAREPAIHLYLCRETPDEETSEALRFQVYMYLLAGENEAALPRQEMICTIGEQLYGDTVDTRREWQRLRRLRQSLQARAAEAVAIPEKGGAHRHVSIQDNLNDVTDGSEAPS